MADKKIFTLQDVHDAFRKTKSQGPTFKRVMKTARMFRSRGVQFNTLSVVNRLSEKRGREIYRFFRDDVGSRYMQFLPAVEHVTDRPEFHRPVIVSPETPGARPALKGNRKAQIQSCIQLPDRDILG